MKDRQPIRIPVLPFLLVVLYQTIAFAQDSTLWHLSPEELRAYDALSKTEVVFVAPRPGILRMFPNALGKAGSPTPASAYLSVVRGKITDTTTVLRYFACSGSYIVQGQDTCTGTPYSVTIYWHSHQLPPYCNNLTPRDTFYVGPVAAGDTVRFFYHAEFNSPTVLIYPAAESLWYANMFTPVQNAQCLTNPYALEACGLLFGYADTLVKFRRPDSLNVYPTYPGKNNTTTKKNFMDLELRVEFADSALRNYPVTVERPALADSGGHSHDGTRPSGRYIVRKTTGAGFDTLNTFTRQTDGSGVLKFKFLASQFGGADTIKAHLVSDSTRIDTVSLITLVKGLQILAEGRNYDLVGGTCKHHGLSDNPGVPTACRTPDNNHYAAQIVRDSLPLLANVWVDSLGNLRLFVNDISLPYGGLFDVSGHWRPEHSEHREGLDVDIRTAIPGVREGVKVRNVQGKWVGNDKFKKLNKKFGVKKAEGHKKGTNEEHFHLDY